MIWWQLTVTTMFSVNQSSFLLILSFLASSSFPISSSAKSFLLSLKKKWYLKIVLRLLLPFLRLYFSHVYFESQKRLLKVVMKLHFLLLFSNFSISALKFKIFFAFLFEFLKNNFRLFICSLLLVFFMQSAVFVFQFWDRLSESDFWVLFVHLLLLCQRCSTYDVSSILTNGIWNCFGLDTVSDKFDNTLEISGDLGISSCFQSILVYQLKIFPFS